MPVEVLIKRSPWAHQSEYRHAVPLTQSECCNGRDRFLVRRRCQR